MNFSDFMECPFDLWEVLIQFDELKKYSEFLEAHLEWPKLVELKKAEGITRADEYFQAIDAIEHKYSSVLPIRFSYTYIIQYCSCLEWSLKKILFLKKYTDLKDKEIKDMKIKTLLNEVSNRLKVEIKNKDEIIELINARNTIVHENGRIEDSKINKWSNSELYKVEKIFDENILVINKKAFFNIYTESSSWLMQCCKA